MVSSGPENSKLIIPEGMIRDDNPVSAALSASLQSLDKSLAPDSEGHVNYVPAAWHFREVIDFISIFMAASSVAPLSPSEAPLPGWRRSLWRVDFAEAACGLLSWAVSYLPKRSRQNPLVEAILKFLYINPGRNAGGETQEYTALLGLGANTNFSQVPWSIWRERFFSRRNLNDIASMAPTIVNYLPHLNAILPAFAEFLSRWRFEVEERKGSCGRLFLNTESSRDELPPFIVFERCSVCHSDKPSIHVLVSPCLGKRFLYREVTTGHLTTIEVDPIFRRRFFTNALSKDRNSLTSLSTVSEPENDVAPLVTESIEELRNKLRTLLGTEVLEHYHIPLLAAVGEAGEAIPIELLRFPGFGIRDGEATAYRLNGLVAFGEDEGVELRSPLVLEICRDMFPMAGTLANRQLAMWAESALQTEESFTPATVLAVRHLSDWAIKSQDTQLIQRLASDSSFMPAVETWLKEMTSSGSSEDRKTALEVSKKLIQFFVSSGVASVGSRVVELCMFCCSVYRGMLDYDKAKQELDRAFEFVSSNDRNRVVKAKVLSERARIYLELELPRQAAEDATMAFDIWSKMADLGDVNALNNLASVACLRAEAQLALGQRSQAIAALQKVVERKANPRTPEASMAWVQLNLQLGELLAEQNASNRQARLRFEEVLRFSKDLPETGKVIEARAKALLGLVNDKDSEVAIANLRQSQVYFEKLIKEQGRSELAHLHADVIYQIAFLLEKSNRLDECLQYTEQAIGIFEQFESKNSNFSNRASLAKLWLLRSRIEELSGRYLEAEDFIAKSLKYYKGLIEDSQVRYISDYAKVLAKRGSLRVMRGAYEEAKEDLEDSIERWPGAHDLKNAKAPLARVFLNLGVAYAHLNSILPALAQFEKGLVISENRNDRATYLQVLSERVWVLFYDGQFKKAEDDFTAIFSGQRGEASHKDLMGRAASCLYQCKYPEALADFSKALASTEENEEDVWALLGVGFACLGLKDVNRARFHFNKIVAALANPTSLPFEKGVVAVVAHFGLAKALALENNQEEAVQENIVGCTMWAESAGRLSDYGNEDAIYKVFSVFYAFVPQILFESTVTLRGHNVAEIAIPPLRAVRNIGVNPIIYRLNPLLNFEAGVELVKAYTSLNMGSEVVSLTQELIEEASEGEGGLDRDKKPSKAQIAWLCLNLVRLITSCSAQPDGSYLTPDYCSKQELYNYLEKAGTIYENLSKQGLSLQDRNDYAELMFSKGLLDKADGKIDSAEEAFKKANRLYSELRSLTDDKGCELELSSVLMNLVELAESNGDEDNTVFLLDEMLSTLGSGVSLPSKDSALRKTFIKNFAAFISRSFANSVGIQDLLGDLIILPFWNDADIESFENALENRLRDRMRRNFIPVFRVIIKNWSSRSRDKQTHHGEKLLDLWLNQGLMDSAAGIRDGLYLLEQLVSFGEECLDIADWADNFAVRAQEGLARFYASEGNNRFAIELLEKAMHLIGHGASFEVKTSLEVDLGIKRAELLIKTGMYEEAKQTLDAAELALQKLKDGNSAFKEKIDHIRIDLFLRGELTPKASNKDNSAEKEVAEGGFDEESPLAKLVKQESSANKAKQRSLAGGFISAVSGRLLGRKNNSPKESPLDSLVDKKEKSTKEELPSAPSVQVDTRATGTNSEALNEVASSAGPESTSVSEKRAEDEAIARPVHVDLNRASRASSIGVSEVDELDSLDAADSVANFATSYASSGSGRSIPDDLGQATSSITVEANTTTESDSSRRVIPEDIGNEVAAQPIESAVAPTIVEPENAYIEENTSPVYEQAPSDTAMSEAVVAPQTSATDVSTIENTSSSLLASTQSENVSSVTSEPTATTVAIVSSPMSVEPAVVATAPIADSEDEAAFGSSAESASVENVSAASAVPTEVAPTAHVRVSAKEALKRQILAQMRSGSNLPKSANSRSEKAESVPEQNASNLPAQEAPKAPKEGVTDMERISARLNSKLARKANVSLASTEISRNKAKTASSASLGVHRDDTEEEKEKQSGSLPTSESRRISLKGAVSEEQLEALAKKAASLPPEPPPKVIPKKQITVPDSLKDRMEKARLRKERQEARQARLSGGSVGEVEPTTTIPELATSDANLETATPSIDLEDIASQITVQPVVEQPVQPVTTLRSAVMRDRSSERSSLFSRVTSAAHVASTDSVTATEQAAAVEPVAEVAPAAVEEQKPLAELEQPGAAEFKPTSEPIAAESSAVVTEPALEVPQAVSSDEQKRAARASLKQALLASRRASKKHTSAAAPAVEPAPVAEAPASDAAAAPAYEPAPVTEAPAYDAAAAPAYEPAPVAEAPAYDTPSVPVAEPAQNVQSQESAAVSVNNLAMLASELLGVKPKAARSSSSGIATVKTEPHVSKENVDTLAQPNQANAYAEFAQPGAAEIGLASEPMVADESSAIVAEPVQKDTKASSSAEQKRAARASLKQALLASRLAAKKHNSAAAPAIEPAPVAEAPAYDAAASAYEPAPVAEAPAYDAAAPAYEPAPVAEAPAYDAAAPAYELTPVAEAPAYDAAAPAYEPAPVAEAPAYDAAAPAYEPTPVAEAPAYDAAAPAYEPAPVAEAPAYDAAAPAYSAVPGLVSEFVAPSQNQGANIYDRQSALKEVDHGFSCLDARDFDGAERCFRNVLGAVNCLTDSRELGEVMAACLEGMNSTGYAMSENGMERRAWQVAKYACEMSRAYLANRYDSAAWPWWGDMERQAGELGDKLQAYDEAILYFRKAIEIYLKLIDLGVGEDSRVDALNTLLKLGHVYEKINQLDEAMQVYSDAIAQGNIVLGNGYNENMTMAEVYRRLAELCMISGYCEAAVDDFAWTLEFYARDSEISNDRHYMEQAAVRARLAEAYLVVGREEEAYGCRNELMDLLDYFNKYRRDQEAAVLSKLINNLDAAANHYRQG